MEEKKLKLSIVILSWNTKALLKQCLKSLEEGCGGVKGCEVIVVDNGSTDGSVEYLRSITGIKSIKGITSMKLVENQSNLGFAKGNNIGIKQARGKYIMLLNSDTIVEKGSMAKLVNYLDQHSEVAAVSPLLLNEDGSYQKDPCYLKSPSLLFVFLYYNPITRKIVSKFLPHLLYSSADFTKPSLIELVSGAAVMLRKEILEKVGGLDEDYPHFFEDVDLSYQLRKLGFRLVLIPEAKVIHLGGRSLQPKIKKEGKDEFYFLNFYGLFLFFRKNYSSFKTFLVKTIVFSQMIITGKFSLVKRLWNKLPRAKVRGIPQADKFVSRLHPRDKSRGIIARNK